MRSGCRLWTWNARSRWTLKLKRFFRNILIHTKWQIINQVGDKILSPREHYRSLSLPSDLHFTSTITLLNWFWLPFYVLLYCHELKVLVLVCTSSVPAENLSITYIQNNYIKTCITTKPSNRFKAYKEKNSRRFMPRSDTCMQGRWTNQVIKKRLCHCRLNFFHEWPIPCCKQPANTFNLIDIC
jgi:hypothetical protein